MGDIDIIRTALTRPDGGSRVDGRWSVTTEGPSTTGFAFRGLAHPQQLAFRTTRSGQRGSTPLFLSIFATDTLLLVETTQGGSQNGRISAGDTLMINRVTYRVVATTGTGIRLEAMEGQGQAPLNNSEFFLNEGMWRPACLDTQGFIAATQLNRLQREYTDALHVAAGHVR